MIALAERAQDAAAGLALRPPEAIMTPEGLSAFKASRLSFLRAVVGRMARERWRIETSRFELDAEGRGLAVYRIETPERLLSFVVFSDKLPEERRTDRIVENHYDGEAFLCLGEPSGEQIARQRPQFADFLLGRADIKTLGWTRVNRSSRVFNRMVEALAAGRQPDPELVESAGYLVRNNGFWGSGRHGTAVMAAFDPSEFIGRPYHIDLLTLYLWRHFSHDLVEHVARCRNPAAATLAMPIKRYIGVGNASGLGLVPFVIRHPRRINGWIEAHETAIARIRAQPAEAADPAALAALLERAIQYYREGVQVRGGIFQSSAELLADLERLRPGLAALRDRGTVDGAASDRPWAALCDWADGAVGREALELLHSLLIEAMPEIATALQDSVLAIQETASDVQPEQRVGELLALVRRHYDWALAIDRGAAGARQHFWYLSEDNLEPRLGERGVDPGEAYETYVDVVGDIQALAADLAEAPAGQSLAAFLFERPQHRAVVERVQSVDPLPYGEVRANVLSDDFEPCHLIRFLLTQYGMEKLDPQSRLWVRGTFLQGAPLTEDIAAGREGDWIFPLLPREAWTAAGNETDQS